MIFSWPLRASFSLCSRQMLSSAAKNWDCKFVFSSHNLMFRLRSSSYNNKIGNVDLLVTTERIWIQWGSEICPFKIRTFSLGMKKRRKFCYNFFKNKLSWPRPSRVERGRHLQNEQGRWTKNTNSQIFIRDKLACVYVVTNCQYSVAQMCTQQECSPSK